jgi:glycosyltransferase involved in cell wall biosynthesis
LRQAANASQHVFIVIGTSVNLNDYISSLNPPTNLSFIISKDPNPLERTNEWLKRGFLILARILRGQGPLEKLAKTNKLDLVWFLGGGCFESLDTPYIATVWDLQHRLQPWFPEVSANGIWAARETQYRYFLARASFVITGTEVGRDEVQLFYEVPKFRIVKLPLPTPQLTRNILDNDSVDVCEKYGIPPNYVFYPAQFWPHKNHVNLLGAIKAIREKYAIELPLVLVGADKGNAPYIREVARELGLQTQLYLLGFVPKADLYDLYKNASLLAYVSLFGPENLPPLEAFAVGCPVLASAVFGSNEQFGDAVLYCDPADPEDIADKIFKLHSDDNLKKRLVELGRSRAELWTADDFVKGVFKIADGFSAIRRNWRN